MSYSTTPVVYGMLLRENGWAILPTVGQDVFDKGNIMELPSHAYAIIRIDEHEKTNLQKKYLVMVKKIVWSMQIAVNEVQRLNELQKDKTSYYCWQQTKIDPNVAPDVHVKNDNSSLFVG
jgi:hypothetical protein